MSPAAIVKPRRLRFRIVRAAVIIVVVLASVLSVAILRGPTHAKLLYHQYRVAHDQLPATQVVYAFSPAARIAADPAAFFNLPLQDVHTHTHTGDDDCELLPPHLVPAGGVGETPALAAFNDYLHFPLSDNFQVLFSHLLSLPDGTRRIAIVSLGPDPRPGPARLAFDILLFEPATLARMPRLVANQRIDAAAAGLAYASTLCFAGQVDPADAGVFHLAFDQQGRRKTLTGSLQPDARRVQIASTPPAAR